MLPTPITALTYSSPTLLSPSLFILSFLQSIELATCHTQAQEKPVPKTRHAHRTRHKKRKEIKDIEFTQGKKEDNIKC